MMKFSKSNFFVIMAMLLFACSSSSSTPADPELDSVPADAEDRADLTGDQASQNSNASGSNQGAADLQAGEEPSQDESGNQEAAEATGQQEGGKASDDGYDDNWNNIGSQEAKEQQAAEPEPEPNPGQNLPLDDDAEPMFGNGAQQANNPQPAPNQFVQTPVADETTELAATEPPVDPEPAPVVEAPPPATPEVPPMAQQAEPAQPAATLASRPALIKRDLEPIYASLVWVGYDHSDRDGIARVEIVTRGSPRFNIFQERNQSDQPELVLRFFQTELRSKVRRDINTAEFRSPVAFIRMRPESIEKYVDVIITLRDAVRPRMYAKNGDIMLTFLLPDHYFGNRTIGDAPVAKAEVLPNDNIMPDLDSDSDISEATRVAKAFMANPAKEVFGTVPADAGQPVQPAPLPQATPAPMTPDGMPQDFNVPQSSPADPAPSEPAPQNAPLVSNNTNSAGANATSSQTNATEADMFSSQASTGEQGVNAEADQQFVGNNFGENVQFDGEPAPAANQVDANSGGNDFGTNQEELIDASQQASNAQGDADAEESQDSQGEDPLDENKLEDFDNGEGESNSQIDKFDVRLRQKSPVIALRSASSRGALAWGLHCSAMLMNLLMGGQAAVAAEWHSFSIGGVAQDNLANDAEFSDETQGQSNQGSTNQNTGNSATANQGEGNNSSGGGNNFGANAQESQGDAGGLDQAGSDDLLGDENTISNLNAVNTGGGAFANTPVENAAAVNATANAATTNAGGNLPANPAASNTGMTPAANATTAAEIPINPVAAATDGGAVPGEPPISGEADLSGQEQTGVETEAVPLPSAGGRPIKLDFRGAPLTEVIRMLGEESGVNFVMPPEIGERLVYINLKGVPFNDALRALLEANALGMIEVGPNIVRIDTLAKLAADKADEENRKKSEIKLQPTKVLVYRLSYAKAEEAQKMLAEMLRVAADARQDQRISVQIDQRTNSIIVNAPANDLSMVKALLERIDLETPQVKIASRIVEVQKKFQELFGVSWAPTLNFDQGRGLGFGNLAFPNSLNSRFAVDAGGSAAAPGTMGMRIGSINNALSLDLALAMEESRSAVEVLQSGNLIVEDNAEAEIVAGSSDFFRLAGAQANGAASEDLAEVTYNLTMKVKPHITADGAVQMKVTLQSDSPAQPASQGGGAIAAKNNRSVTTSLLRKSGETAVIGGIYNTQKQKANRGVPVLMHIPIIGALFRSANDVEEKRELLVMVTPTIINGAGRGMAAQDGAEFSGQAAAAASSNANQTLNAAQNGGNNANFGGNNFGGNETEDFSDDTAGQQNLQEQQAVQQTQQQLNQQGTQQVNVTDQDVELEE